MAEVELECAVYGEGTVCPVKIARDAKMSALQEAIFYKKRYNRQYNFDSSALTLYLARKKEGEEIKWLKDDDSVEDLLSGKTDAAYKKMRPSWKLTKAELLGPDFQPEEEEIHVLVELPTHMTHEWSAEDLSTVDPQVQLKVWKSVVRVSSEDACSETAFVVDRTATHLYLLTNLRLWVDEAFTDDLSADFNKEIK